MEGDNRQHFTSQEGGGGAGFGGAIHLNSVQTIFSETLCRQRKAPSESGALAILILQSQKRYFRKRRIRMPYLRFYKG